MEKEVIEGNVLIAEFMQGFRNPQERWHAIIPNQNGYYSSQSLRYNESWDWLMPVVEKIEKLNNGDSGKGYIVSIKSPSCVGYIDKSDSFQMPVPCDARTLGDTRIESVWKAVVEFMKWRNVQNKK